MNFTTREFVIAVLFVSAAIMVLDINNNNLTGMAIYPDPQSVNQLDAAAHCSNSILDGSEIYVDCGGNCSKCTPY